jgi:hypothetical protein
MIRFYIRLTVLLLLLSVLGCSKKAKYENMVKRGIESGLRHDTIFLGIYLGMSSQDFYTHCWELNKQGLIRQGSGNASVLYELKSEFKAEVAMNFYPNFYLDSIYEMPVKFQYKGWSPWTRSFSQDTLQLELLELYEQWYGHGFMEINHPERGKAFVKVDGNRRISIYKDQSADGTVWVLYRDMSRELQQQSSESSKR